MPILMALSAVFKGWLLIDAMRRGGCCNNYWYMVIILVPFGEWAYFFMIKIVLAKLQFLTILRVRNATPDSQTKI